MSERIDVAVIGCGLAGLAALRELKQPGVAARGFDKARGPGGRLSSRRDPRGTFDLGAQQIQLDGDGAEELRTALIDAGVASSWGDGLCGTPRMSAITRHLSEGLDCAFSTRIVELVRDDSDGLWTGRDEGGEPAFAAERVIVAIPPVQASELLGADPLGSVADSGEIAPCWTAVVEAPPIDGRQVLPLGPKLGGVATYQGSKPGREGTHAWVIQAGPVWSTAAIESEPDPVLAELTAAFAGASGLTPTPLFAHRWRYSRLARLATGDLSDGARGIALAGDWTAGPLGGDAVRSGFAAVDALL